MKTQRINLYLLTIILLLTSLLLLDKRFMPAKTPQPQFSPSSPELISTVMRLIKTDYLEEPNPNRTIEGAFRGLINSLDTLSAYLDKDLAAKYQKKKAKTASTGLIIFKRYGVFPVVVSLLENSPAARAGLRVGDNISAINDRNPMNFSQLETNLLLEADPDKNGREPLKLRVVRGTETMEFEVTRDFIAPTTLQITARPSQLVSLKPSFIYQGLSQEIKKSLSLYLKKGAAPKAVVLDLRDCWTGDYEEARKIINLFLKEEEAGYFERRGQKQPFSCPDKPDFPNLPLIVWVNQATYGPAEVVAGVLKDLGRAKVIGTATPGLAGKQESFPLPDGSLVVLTTAVFSLKSGTKLWDNSLPLDEKLSFTQDLEKAYLDKTLSLITVKN